MDYLPPNCLAGPVVFQLGEVRVPAPARETRHTIEVAVSGFPVRVSVWTAVAVPLDSWWTPRRYRIHPMEYLLKAVRQTRSETGSGSPQLILISLGCLDRPVEMSNYVFASACENGHVIDSSESHEDLTEQPRCHHCGTSVHSACPECGANTVLLRYWEKDDEEGYNYDLDEYCGNCGDAFAWGPGWVQNMLDKRGISLSGSSSPSPRGTIIGATLRDILTDTEYGDEIISHVTEGDRCFKNRLWRSSLSMYVLAYEWTIITYLEDREDFDVISKERQGTYFNLAGEGLSLLNVLTDKVELDQKMVDRIHDLNQAERRWVAHHKSGEVFREEVESVRARLGVLLDQLFSNRDGE